MAKIFVGTSGFSYDDWKDNFYPTHLPNSDYLSFYSQEFNVVELNFSYYRIPELSQCRRMLEKSGHRVEFVIKAFKGLTHEITNQSIPEVLPQFKESITPFSQTNTLGAVLLQFPQRFHYTPTSRVYLQSLIKALSPMPVCVEFRQREWLKDSVYTTLKELNAGFVCVDEPPLRGLLPPLVVATSDIGYIRFHGRNRSKWYTGDAKERYDYLYSEDELKGWLPKISSLAEQTEKMFIFFNNHKKAQAIINARMMMDLLDK
ncbi:MAG: DUF72 domain-containing protein [Deltaproteobacteria bacterium]|nr:MAG: DUF72 domain-containing protein [Deltaproteobacteria bacterium]